MTEHPKNDTEWSDDDHMERIFAAWVQSRPADAAAAEAPGTEAGSPEAPTAGATGAAPATEEVVSGDAAANGGPAVEEVPGDEPAFPRSLAKKTTLPDWFVDEPSTPSPPPHKPAATFPEPSDAHEAALANPWDDEASFPDTSEEEPPPPEPAATDSRAAATSTGWSRTDDDVIPRRGKRRWRRKGR